MNEVEAEGLSTFAQAEEGALSVALVIDRGGLIAVWRAVAEHAEDNDGELTGGGSDGLGFADASSEAAVEGSEGVITAGEAHDGDAEGLGGATRGGLGGGTEEFATGDFVVGREGEPGSEVVGRGPTTHVESGLVVSRYLCKRG